MPDIYGYKTTNQTVDLDTAVIISSTALNNTILTLRNAITGEAFYLWKETSDNSKLIIKKQLTTGAYHATVINIAVNGSNTDNWYAVLNRSGSELHVFYDNSSAYMRKKIVDTSAMTVGDELGSILESITTPVRMDNEGKIYTRNNGSYIVKYNNNLTEKEKQFSTTDITDIKLDKQFLKPGLLYISVSNATSDCVAMHNQITDIVYKTDGLPGHGISGFTHILVSSTRALYAMRSNASQVDIVKWDSVASMYTGNITHSAKINLYALGYRNVNGMTGDSAGNIYFFGDKTDGSRAVYKIDANLTQASITEHLQGIVPVTGTSDIFGFDHCEIMGV